jgi:hypothetical protein
MKGLHHGRWSMAERSSSDNPEQQALIDVTDLGDPEPLEDAAFDPKLHPREAKRRAAAKAKGRKYDFEMVLGLGSTSRGRSVDGCFSSGRCVTLASASDPRLRSCRWNKLNLIDYFSINKATGEELPIKLLNQGPFYFSKSARSPLQPLSTRTALTRSRFRPPECAPTSPGAIARPPPTKAADRCQSEPPVSPSTERVDSSPVEVPGPGPRAAVFSVTEPGMNTA